MAKGTLFLSPVVSFWLRIEAALSENEMPVIWSELIGAMNLKQLITMAAAPYRYPTRPAFFRLCFTRTIGRWRSISSGITASSICLSMRPSHRVMLAMIHVGKLCYSTWDTI